MRQVERYRMLFGRTCDEADAICGMKSIDCKPAEVRRHLPGIGEQAPIEFLPNSIAVFGAGNQDVLVVEPLIVETAQRFPTSGDRQVCEWYGTSRLRLVAFG